MQEMTLNSVSLRNYSSGAELGPLQLRPVAQGAAGLHAPDMSLIILACTTQTVALICFEAVTLVDLRLLALGTFPGDGGPAQALAAADQAQALPANIALALHACMQCMHAGPLPKHRAGRVPGVRRPKGAGKVAGSAEELGNAAVPHKVELVGSPALLLETERSFMVRCALRTTQSWQAPSLQ